MRWASLFGLGLLLCGVSCFEDSPPVTDSGPADTGNCMAGTEGCVCIEDDCVGELVCLSNTCVDPGSTNEGTTAGAEGADSVTGAAEATSNSDGNDTNGNTDDGPPPPPPTTGGGSLPPGATCHPLNDQCSDGLACVGLGDFEMFCAVPGPLAPGDECGFDKKMGCDAGTLCINADSFDDCPGIGCCTTICDGESGDLGQCEPDQFCDRFYPRGSAPGYSDVGICVNFK